MLDDMVERCFNYYGPTKITSLARGLVDALDARGNTVLSHHSGRWHNLELLNDLKSQC